MAKQSLKDSPIDAISGHLPNLIAKIRDVDLGEPVHLSPEAFQQMLDRLRNFRENYSAMTFWSVVSVKDNIFLATGGLDEHFGQKVESRTDFYMLIHPDYINAFFQWVSACFEMILKVKDKVQVLEGSFRITIPLRQKDGSYYWYSQHTTVTQQDAHGFVVTYLNTYYKEEKWSPLMLRPFGTYVQLESDEAAENEQVLHGIIAPYIIDEFTNSELQLINLYSTGLTGAAVAKKIGWSRHTLNEYNVTILKKARRIFQYSFRSAREFSLYCLERGFIHKRQRDETPI